MIASPNKKCIYDILMNHAEVIPAQTAFTSLVGNCQEQGKITFFELDRGARQVAVLLMARRRAGRPVMLLLNNPINFAVAFFGCIYAGVTAVPAPVPQFGKSWSRVDAIAGDAGIETILTDNHILQSVQKKEPSKLAAFRHCQYLVMEECDTIDASHWRRPDTDREQPAFLQYTSGSTGAPKGVMVSHENVLANVQAIAKYLSASEHSVQVSWLPLFHDMGLVGHIILPVYVGCHSVIMKPLDFIKRPIRWLKAISQYGGIISGAPNFAYELCLSRIKEDESAGLDLTTWRSAYVGAEPVRLKTLQRFSQRFQDTGFQKTSFLPLYGLSEGTLMVSGVDPQQGICSKNQPVAKATASPYLFLQNRVVGCGYPIGDQQVTVVHPDSCQPLANGEVGEIWLTGSNIAKGYWQKDQETETFFKARLATGDSTQYLRTGDIGFVHEGELFITGRLKDVLIIKGENYAAADLELSAERSHTDILAGGCAAFSIFVDGDENAVLACETKHGLSKENKEDMVAAVCAAYSKEYGFLPFDIVFVKKHALPRTTSGKVRRQACRDRYLDGAWQSETEQVSSPNLAKQRNHKRVSGGING